MVVDVRNTRRRLESGTARLSVAYTGDQRINTPRGEYLAHRIDVEFTADLRLVDVIDRTTYFVVPEVGVVAEERDEKITMVGIPRRTRRSLVLNRSEPAGEEDEE